jgi:hypothetical protein
MFIKGGGEYSGEWSNDEINGKGAFRFANGIFLYS